MKKILTVLLLISQLVFAQKDDKQLLTEGISLLNSQVIDLCCSDSISRENALEKVRASFEKIMVDYPESDLKDDAQYFIAKAQFYTNDFNRVRLEFQKIVDLYPNNYFSEITLSSNWIGSNIGLINWYNTDLESDAYAQGVIASSYYEDSDGSNDSMLVVEYKKLIANYPDSKMAAEAQHKIGAYYNGKRERYLAVAEYEKVLNQYPDALFWVGYSYDHIGSMLAAISDWNRMNHFKERLENEQCKNNYLSECFFGIPTYKRWNKSGSQKLSVYAHHPDGSQLTADYNLIVDSIITIMNKGLENGLFLQRVQSQSEGGNIYNGSDIEIRFEKEPSQTYAQVSSEVIVPFSSIQRAIISINSNRSFNAIFKSALHELGHAFGLGHSFNSDDIMFYSTTQVESPQLSSRDINTLKLLYSTQLKDTLIACSGDTIHLSDGYSYSGGGTYTTIPLLSNCLELVTTTVSTELPYPANSIRGKNMICGNETGVIYTIPEIVNASHYIWTLPNGDTVKSDQNSLLVDFSDGSNSGNISVRGANSCGQGTASTLYITVKNKPPAPGISLSGNILHSDASFGNQWYNQNGKINKATNQDYTVTENGDYYVIVTLSGCSSAISNSINVNITGNEVTENSKTIKVYPNPVSNELTIEIEGNNQGLNFEILNVKGQVVYKGNFVRKTTVPINHLAPGTYFIKLENGGSFDFKKIRKV